MRRLTLELSQEDIGKSSPTGKLLERMESLEIVHYLRCDREGFAGICRIRTRDPDFDPASLVGVGGVVRLEALSASSDERIVYLETRTSMDWFQGPEAPQVYLCPPVEFKDGRLRLTFLGNAREVKKFLARAARVGPPFRLLSLTDARFSPDSLLQNLTERQRRILAAAYTGGYYDVPRRINSEELAQRLHVVKSTLVEHLRKAERTLLADIMREQGGSASPASARRR